ncbi:MAG: hypothetical protein GC146_10820 [Limimaricola sp.]|uniref:hypothetical protein n=1 Tax=Limimaricola sp. TaxID=2211665 RepID=UPI001DE36F6D|nr:hypothetical protein [Limimaricola sp.]MBI1417703.1 hypothetical protein [Limimaricola sp.]
MYLRTTLAAALVGMTLAGCDTTTTTTTYAAVDRHVRIVNHTNRTIYRFYGSNVGTNSWEEDILGQDVLLPGQSVNINFNDGSRYCNFDFKIVFADGSSAVESNINVCRVGTYTLS